MFLLPEGLGEVYGLEESSVLASTLLSELEANGQLLDYQAFVRDKLSIQGDGGHIALNSALWGNAINPEDG